ncbi:MAG TPA: site-specific integrase [Steroidobacteraceae bacterium]|nr:site-specific integrase [Steroidobacteraceae bacterium]
MAQPWRYIARKGFHKGAKSRDASDRANQDHAGFVAFRKERIKAGTKRATVRLDLALISHLYTIARKEWGMPYLTNPIADVRQPKADKWRDRRLSAEELERFQQAIDTCYNGLIPINIRVALETAARKSELLKLTWDDVDLGRRVMILRDTKNGDDRRVPLSQTAVSLFEQLPRDESGRVFPTTSDATTAAWRRILIRAQIKDFRYHDLRHEATTRLFERGLEIMEVQRITGHKTLSQLLRYTQMNVDRIVDRLDETESPSGPASPRASSSTRGNHTTPPQQAKRRKSHPAAGVLVTAHTSPDSVRGRAEPNATSFSSRPAGQRATKDAVCSEVVWVLTPEAIKAILLYGVDEPVPRIMRDAQSSQNAARGRVGKAGFHNCGADGERFTHVGADVSNETGDIALRINTLTDIHV